MLRRKPAPTELINKTKWAKEFFDIYVTAPSTPHLLSEAYLLLAEHIVRLEQYIKRVDGGIESARSDLPELLYSPRHVEKKGKSR